MNVCWWWYRRKKKRATAGAQDTRSPSSFCTWKERDRTTPDFDRATHSQRHVGSSDVAQEEEEKINQPALYVYCFKNKKKHLHNIHQWGYIKKGGLMSRCVILMGSSLLGNITTTTNRRRRRRNNYQLVKSWKGLARTKLQQSQTCIISWRSPSPPKVFFFLLISNY